MKSARLEQLVGAFAEANPGLDQSVNGKIFEDLQGEAKNIWRLFNTWAAGALLLNLASYYFGGIGIGLCGSSVLALMYGGISFLIEQKLVALNYQVSQLAYASQSRSILWSIYVNQSDRSTK